LHSGVLCLKTCRYCSKQNMDNNNYCNSCRTVLSSFPDQPQRGQCLICGTQSAADARFCGFCSSPLVRYGWALSSSLSPPLILLIRLDVGLCGGRVEWIRVASFHSYYRTLTLTVTRFHRLQRQYIGNDKFSSNNSYFTANGDFAEKFYELVRGFGKKCSVYAVVKVK